jgi:3-hydroxyisobutyrate dehydrogenase-like beta-hydroxyacid dehydrogenase
MPFESSNLKIALIGFGEAAQAFCKGWGPELTNTIKAYDIKCHKNDAEEQLSADYASFGIEGCANVTDCISDADIIFSLVTADQAFVAGENGSKNIPKNCFYFDCNSCAPDTKRKISLLIANAGGRYVDVAVMAPVYPTLHKVPLLICGPHANEAKLEFLKLGMSAEFVAGDIGKASSIKMVRSIMMKGLEALVAECVLAGRKAGIEDIVLDTLEKTYPGFNWKERSTNMLERIMAHGPRRAAEMREVALTVKQLGLDNAMSSATIGWQQTIGDLGLPAGEDVLSDRADAIIAALAEREKK